MVDAGSTGVERDDGTVVETRRRGHLQVAPLSTILVAAFGCWTVGYWIALAVRSGWAVAVPVSVAFGVVVRARGRSGSDDGRWPDAPTDDLRSTEDIRPVVAVVATAFAVPLLLDAGRGVMVVASAALLGWSVVAQVVSRRSLRPVAPLLAALAGGAAATAAFATGWWLAAALLGAAGIIVVVRPELVDAVPGVVRAATAPDHHGERRLSTAGQTVALLVLGIAIGVWYMGTSAYWSPDNAYYINKAAHYGDSPWSFEIQDHMYGVDGVTHIPFGNILASYEPLIGTLAELLGVSAFDLLFTIVVPLTMGMIPFAARAAARGMGAARPGLVGAVAGALVLVATAASTVSLAVTGSLGKLVGSLVVAPVFLGALAALARAPSKLTAGRASLASVALVGVTPSLAMSGLLVALCFAAASLWPAIRRPRMDLTIQEVALRCSAAAFLICHAGFAKVFQASAGDAQLSAGFRSFAEPSEAWSFAYGPDESNLLTVFFVLGATLVVPLALPDASTRRAWGFVLFGFFGLLFSPWGFEPLVDDVLDLNHFAWRFFWALPATVIIGVVVATVARASRFGSLVSVAAVIVLALSGPSLDNVLRPQAVRVWERPHVLPWESGATPGLLSATESVVAATPTGGRFLAPSRVEEVATAMQTDAKPTYVRPHYVTVALNDEAVDETFHAEERLLLGGGANGRARQTTRAEWTRALDVVDVHTVCLSDGAAPTLRAAVEQGYERGQQTTYCQIWTR